VRQGHAHVATGAHRLVDQGEPDTGRIPDAENHLTNLVRRRVLDSLQSDFWLDEAQQQLALRVRLVPELAERLASDSRLTWNKYVNVKAEAYNTACDDLILGYLTDSMQRSAGRTHEMVQ
jgi:hypothetical protein